jgi:hypothetical protein
VRMFVGSSLWVIELLPWTRERSRYYTYWQGAAQDWSRWSRFGRLGLTTVGRGQEWHASFGER